MKKVLKFVAVVIGIAGGIALGYLMNLALTGIPYFSLALIAALAVLFVGGTGLIALFILLWSKANGDADIPADTEVPDEDKE